MLISKDSEMVRVQCAFVDTPEVDAITKFIADQQGYPEAYALPEYVSDTENGVSGDIDLGVKDPLFEEAARLVVNTQQGSQPPLSSDVSPSATTGQEESSTNWKRQASWDRSRVVKPVRYLSPTSTAWNTFLKPWSFKNLKWKI